MNSRATERLLLSSNPAALVDALRASNERVRDLEEVLEREDKLIQSFEANLQLHKDVSDALEEQLRAKDRHISVLEKKLNTKSAAIRKLQKLCEAHDDYNRVSQAFSVASHNYSASLENLNGVLREVYEKRESELLHKVGALNKEREEQGILAKRRQELLKRTRAELRHLKKHIRETARLNSPSQTRRALRASRA